MRGMKTTPWLAGAALALAVSTALAQPRTPHDQSAFDIYKELVEMNTVTTTGDTAKAADAMAARLVAAGIPADDVKVFKPAPNKGNVIARYRGTGARKPIILMAHIDVVEAKREDWTTDPFKLVEKDGFFYGRGTSDDKSMAAAFVANLVRYKQGRLQARSRPDPHPRDRRGDRRRGENGIGWIVEEPARAHRRRIRAQRRRGRGARQGQAASRGRADRREGLHGLLARGARCRRPQLAAQRAQRHLHLAAGLSQVGALTFPMQLNETTRLWFQRAADFEEPKIGADMRRITQPNPDPEAAKRLSAIPRFNAQMRTTCVATMLQGGHAPNALPQLAKANVNCRILPGEPVDEVEATLKRLAGDGVKVSRVYAANPSQPSPITPELFGAIEEALRGVLARGADHPVDVGGCHRWRVPSQHRHPDVRTFGTRGEVTENRAHGRDERVQVDSFYEGVEYLYRLVKMLSGGK